MGTLWRSEDGGLTWTDADPPPTTTGVQALHPDLHAIVFASDGSRMYIGNDGGLWSTTNVTTSPVTWTNLNAPLSLIASLALAFVRRRRAPLIAGAVLLATLALTCGGSGGGGGGTSPSPGTPAGTYQLTVTGTSGNLRNQIILTLNVQ